MLIFNSRKGRKGRRTSNANYAIAEVVAGYARQRVQRQIVDEDGNHPPPPLRSSHLSQGDSQLQLTNAITLPSVALRECDPQRVQNDMSHSSKDPLRPLRQERVPPQGGGGG